MGEGKKNIGTYTVDDPSLPGVVFPVEVSDPTKRIQAYLESWKRGSIDEGFDEDLMRNRLKVIHATAPPNVTAIFEVEITPAFGNRLGNMHGGAMALVYDMCTTAAAAPLARKGFWEFGGVSRVLSVTYLRPARVGTVIRIECEVIQMGGRLATIRGVMKEKDSGKVLSVAEHNKASITLQEKSKM